jgi:hypothetical protein
VLSCVRGTPRAATYSTAPPPPPAHTQSILTGESHSADKDPRPVVMAKAVYQDKTNMLYSVGRGWGCRGGGART